MTSAETILQTYPPDVAEDYRQYQQALGCLPRNIGKAKEEDRLTAAQKSALALANAVEQRRGYALLTVISAKINRAIHEQYDAECAVRRTAKVKELAALGLHPGMKMYYVQQHMLGLMARRVEGTLKIGKDGVAYISAAVQRGRLRLQGWRIA